MLMFSTVSRNPTRIGTGRRESHRRGTQGHDGWVGMFDAARSNLRLSQIKTSMGHGRREHTYLE